MTATSNVKHKDDVVDLKAQVYNVCTCTCTLTITINIKGRERECFVCLGLHGINAHKMVYKVNYISICGTLLRREDIVSISPERRQSNLHS